ncbi:MAG: ATP-binding protein [Desulfovibrionaceae bacterium]
MNIRLKILLFALPLTILPALLVGLVSAYFSHRALTDLLQEAEQARIEHALDICRLQYAFTEGPAGVSVAEAKRRAAAAMAGMSRQEDSLVWAFDSQGVVRAHPEPGLVDGAAPQGLIARVTPNDRGETRFAWRGERWRAAYGFFAPWNWWIVNSQPTSQVTAPHTELTAAISLVVLGCILAAMAAFYWLARWLASPLQELIANVDRIRRGQLDTHIPITTEDEIGVLCGAFNAMTARLRRMVGNLEYMVEQRTQELDRRARELESANLRLTEMDHMKSAIMSTVTHDLRTPMTSILGFTKLVSRDIRKTIQPLAGQDPKADKTCRRVLANLDIISLEGERLTRLINDFLDLSKIESGRMEWRFDQIRVEALLDQAMNSVRGEYEKKPSIRLLLDVDPDLPPLKADPDRMQQVLVNLLNNAAKFTEQGHVAVRAGRHNGSVRFRVEDTGAGIPEEELDRVFDKFHQVDRSDTRSSKHGGAGLGLAICREIVLRHGGRIWAESHPGQGSAFIFDIPTTEGGDQKPDGN